MWIRIDSSIMWIRMDSSVMRILAAGTAVSSFEVVGCIWTILGGHQRRSSPARPGVRVPQHGVLHDAPLQTHMDAHARAHVCMHVDTVTVGSQWGCEFDACTCVCVCAHTHSCLYVDEPFELWQMVDIVMVYILMVYIFMAYIVINLYTYGMSIRRWNLYSSIWYDII